jgi:hypothetical protein
MLAGSPTLSYPSVFDSSNLQNQLDRMKRKALLGPGNLSTAANVRDSANMLGDNAASGGSGESRSSIRAIGVGNPAAGTSGTHSGENAMASVVSEMEANKACFGTLLRPRRPCLIPIP